MTQQQATDDLGIGLSTLGKWITSHKHAELVSGSHDDKDKEQACLRKEARIIRKKRDILKNPPGLETA
ncbi:hypothetical protein [Cohaesibacter celericrescens]|uniref:hypothetical protein n=1 Tax=Cohaesibacter celericrescens TaxID=2067669 RepID=UPI0011AF6999|nr:hypothetical protein [Cohaesibacter celericrescens]